MLLAAAALAPIALIAGNGEASRAGDEARASHTIPVPMPDGVRLATDVYLPAADGRFPVVLLRSPYDRRQLAPHLFEPLTRAGYAVVSQDVRGMNGSEGRFIPFIFEKDDGLATLDWIAGQEWCDGRIAMWGPSYIGFCAMVLAAEDHPNLKTIVNLGGWSDTDAMVRPGGALHLMLALPWTYSGQISGDTAARRIDWLKAFPHLPIANIPGTLGLPAEPLLGTQKLIESGVLAQRASLAGAYQRVRIPILHLTGWYDFLSPLVLSAYGSLAAAPAARAGGAAQALVVGPWRHDQIWGPSTKVGDADFGPEAAMGMEKVVGLTIEWLDRHLAHRPGAAPVPKNVRAFVMGENRWREFDLWPPAGTRERRWFADSRAGAQGLSGDGVLRPDARGRGADTYRYDPNDPVPTMGGANCHFFPALLGVRDQRPVEERRDVLVYTTPPLERALTLVGPLRAEVYASTRGASADIVVKLVDVRPGGYAAILADGIRHDPDPIAGAPVGRMTPGQVYRFTVDLGGTAVRLEKGHRVRLEITSGNFPKYARNPGTGEDPATATVLVPIEQTIHHTREHPTALVAHVLE
jgi:putative CocE/NonD family hydrolase